MRCSSEDLLSWDGTVGGGDEELDSSLPELLLERNGTILLNTLENLEGLVLLLEELVLGSAAAAASCFKLLIAICWVIYVLSLLRTGKIMNREIQLQMVIYMNQ
jgi:hypothetical protein